MGINTVPAEVLSAIRETFACGCADDAQVREEIRARYEADGYLCDTHTAVAFRVARQQAAGETPCVVLSTASPYKFPCDVLGALGADVPEDEFEAMRLLQEKDRGPGACEPCGPAGKARTLHAGGGKGRHPGCGACFVEKKGCNENGPCISHEPFCGHFSTKPKLPQRSRTWSLHRGRPCGFSL